MLEGLTLTKAHGAGNDFILIPDFDGRLRLDAQTVAALCDRHRGVGADGVIRVVRARALQGADAVDAGVGPEWFMDYRNADGSLAEMCGNGVRVFVHYLRVQGVVDVPVGGSLAVATRGGVKTVVFDGPSYTVDMGPYELPEGQSASIRVDVPGVGVRDGVRVDMPNPHAVVLLADERELQAARLTEQPVYDPAPADGINLELVGPGSPAPMRVLERGVGETLACGTGTCAAALAVLLAAERDEGTVDLSSPGGQLAVRIAAGRAYLTGPAVLVAEFALLGIAGYAQ